MMIAIGDEVKMPKQPARRRFGTVLAIRPDGRFAVSVRNSFSTVFVKPEDMEKVTTDVLLCRWCDKPITDTRFGLKHDHNGSRWCELGSLAMDHDPSPKMAEVRR